ncbi:hypothetical protein Gohar_025779 [Gossypium harknessii]|uniref:7-dehydrocholesterol reductase n=1 Tax=Gossypium harknessii TaxID=34285 RepID=A0A7J9HPI8_9ROSI|nr:hypothetical protein [Gossypium harknessii]
MVHADGSVAQTWNYLKQHGLQGFIDIWPRPTAIAWKIIFVYGAFEAALQLLLPGKRVEGPISPTGNRPVYKANGMAAYFVTLVTYISLWWFEIFNPTVVYDHLGEIYSALIFGSLIFCVFLYIKGHVAPSSTDSGSSGNFIIDFYWGMELYPRIGKNFDIKVFTNCRFGMMSWAVLAVTYCIKQYELNGKVSDSMLVNTTLMLVYVTKFFWWEAGYWNTMDIAHDRGLHSYFSMFNVLITEILFQALSHLNSYLGFGSWILYLLGLLGLGSIRVYFTRDVPCQPSGKPWNAGMLTFL